MAKDESIGSPMAGSISSQINQRQKFHGSTDRNKFVVAYNDGKSAFASLRSSVDIDGSSNLAKSYVLGSKLSGGINKSAGTSNAYNLSSTTGIRPKPGITSVNVSSKGSYGTLLLATVNFKVFSKEDLDNIEKVYFKPGFTALLEYGHSVYVDNAGTVINMSSGKLYGDDFFNSSETGRIENKIDELVSSTDHNYEALYGFIQNFSWSLAEDGSYDCSVKIVSKNHVLESIKAPSLSSNVKDGELEVKEEQSSTGFAGLLDFIFERLKRQDKKSMFKGKDHLADSSKTGGNVSSVAKHLPQFYIQRTSITLADTGWFWNLLAADKKNLQYIRLGDLLHILNKFVVLKDAKGHPICEFSTSPGEMYTTTPEHYTTNPLVAIMPKLPTGATANRKVVRNLGGDAGDGIQESLQSQAKYYQKEGDKFNGKHDILNIGVCTDFIINTLSGVTTGPQEDGVGIFDFLNSLLAGIELAFGGINNFMIFFNGKKNIIVDSGNKSITKKNAPIIEITGLKSTVYNVNMSSKLSNKIGSQIAIAAGGAQNDYGENVANLMDFATRHKAKDRHVGEICQTEEQVNAKFKAIDKKRAAYTTLQKIIDDVYEEFNDEGKDFSAKNWDILQSESISNQIADLAKNLKDKNELSSIPVPIEITLTMVGIGGLKNGTVFQVPTKVLPSGYEGYGFIICGVDHTIGTDNKWTTAIRAKMYKLQ